MREVKVEIVEKGFSRGPAPYWSESAPGPLELFGLPVLEPEMKWSGLEGSVLQTLGTFPSKPVDSPAPAPEPVGPAVVVSKQDAKLIAAEWKKQYGSSTFATVEHISECSGASCAAVWSLLKNGLITKADLFVNVDDPKS